jgi:hypothetical protein
MVIVYILIGAVLLAGPLYRAYWLYMTRSHPRTQKAAPDLSAFERDAGHNDGSA